MFEGFGLGGKVAIVTGAGSGIGRATALAFGQAGSRVVVMDRDGGSAERTTAELRSKGAEALSVTCDVSDFDGVNDAAKASEEAFGPCDVLVNNAGVQVSAKLATISLADWNRIISINLTGALICSQAFGAQMKAKGGGSIVHVASMSSDHPSLTAASYSVSKAGLVMLSRALSVELAPFGIRSNAVKPGMIRTALSEAVYRVPGLEKRRTDVIPAGRIGESEDVSNVILFLASDGAAYVTGQELMIDGGYERMLNSFIPRP